MQKFRQNKNGGIYNCVPPFLYSRGGPPYLRRQGVARRFWSSPRAKSHHDHQDVADVTAQRDEVPPQPTDHITKKKYEYAAIN